MGGERMGGQDGRINNATGHYHRIGIVSGSSEDTHLPQAWGKQESSLDPYKKLLDPFFS